MITVIMMIVIVGLRLNYARRVSRGILAGEGEGDVARVPKIVHLGFFSVRELAGKTNQLCDVSNLFLKN